MLNLTSGSSQIQVYDINFLEMDDRVKVNHVKQPGTIRRRNLGE
jgi:hypothetical protein